MANKKSQLISQSILLQHELIISQAKSDFLVSTDSSHVVMQEQEQQGSGFGQADKHIPGAGPSGRGAPPQDQWRVMTLHRLCRT